MSMVICRPYGPPVVLFLSSNGAPGEPYGPLVEYLEFHGTLSPTFQDVVVRGLGLLWDFCQARGSTIVTESLRDNALFRPTLLKRFTQALLAGTVEDDEDPSGLFWPAISYRRAKELVRAIEKFAAWCAARRRDPGTLEGDDVPPDAANFTDLLIASRLCQTSMLEHLGGGPRRVRSDAASKAIADQRGYGVEPVNHFPAIRMIDLLWTGYARRGHEEDPDFFRRFCVRDIMMALLCAFGGLRRSEPLHLWVQDVVEDPEAPGHAIVVLNHPTEAMIKYPDRLTGKTLRMSRANALKRIYGLSPRSDVKRGRYASGWKSPELDARYQARVLWTLPAASALFWALYCGYRRYVREPLMSDRRALGLPNHPFLFVAEGEARRDGKITRGAPYSRQAYDRNHNAAVRRIGLDPKKDLGTTTHGLRHLFGQTLADLKLPPQVIKKAMRHRSYLSQVVYTAPTYAKANADLNRAIGNCVAGGPAPTAEQPDESTTAALFRLSESITSWGPR